MPSKADTLFTIGHSTHPIEVFLELLAQHRIRIVADVRSFPASRRWPQFNQEPLHDSLREQGIEYRWMKSLGGRRHSKRSESPHQAWRIEAFRSYADYAEGADFKAGLKELSGIARSARCVIMCSEGLWWRCHRRIVADHLTVAGWRVEHILPHGKTSAHQLSEFARVEDGAIIYDGGQPLLKPAD